jgi:putative endonuclease
MTTIRHDDSMPPPGHPALSKLHYGLQIERMAEGWYLRCAPEGTLLLERNFRYKGGEIDLIFEEPGELVFVEVRARDRAGWVGGVESVGPAKIRRLRRGVDVYLARYRGHARGARLDVMAWDGIAWEHWRDAVPCTA